MRRLLGRLLRRLKHLLVPAICATLADGVARITQWATGSEETGYWVGLASLLIWVGLALRIRRWLKRRPVRLAVRFPDATFHLEVMPDGIVRPVLDDPRILDPHATERNP